VSTSDWWTHAGLSERHWVDVVSRSHTLYPFIIIAGMLQAAGAPINGQLKSSLINPWLASSVSFLLVTFLAIALF
jgi:hypothetical protein